MRFRRGTRGTHWSNSKLAKKLYAIVGVSKLPYGTFEDWDDWETTTKKNHPQMYFFIETVLDNMQDVVLFPKDVYRSIKTYIRNRFIDKNHYLQTRLKPGEYHEIDTRILHGLFETLVDYVEIELAHMNQYSEYFRKPKLKQSSEDGLKYLEWEMSQKSEDGIHYTAQAISAREIYELYTWWKTIRPNRPDPYEASGYTEYHNSVYGNEFHWSLRKYGTERQYEELMRRSRLIEQIDKQYYDEDEQMMIRLIKIRTSMWT